MGSTRPSRPRVTPRMPNLSSFICGGGGASSRAPVEVEYPETLVNAVEQSVSLYDGHHSPPKESLPLSGSGSRLMSPIPDFGTSSQGVVTASQDSLVGDASRNSGTGNQEKYLFENRQLVPPIQSGVECSLDDSCQDTKRHISPEPTSVSITAGSDNDRLTNASMSQSSHVRGDSQSGLAVVENHVNEVVAIHNSDADVVPVVSDLSVGPQLQREDPVVSDLTSSVGLLVSDTDRRGENRGGGFLQVDVVSMASNILSSTTAEVSNHEARRNDRRLFWDSFSRRSSRRHADSPTNDRWLRDFGGEIFGDGTGNDSGYISGQLHRMNEQRLHSRSEVWESLRGGFGEHGQRNNFCPSGLHLDGMCSCESSLIAEEYSTRSSMSRLAEALFEVLDEIHRRPPPYSMSMVSLAAPGSLVDSFPLRSHIKLNTAKIGSDNEQCYICLADYEVGDKIRSLPCQHEYHMSCVDKWLKEIHGVCPLCRGDVRETTPA